MDDDSPGRPERRTAVVTRELQRFNIDIAALFEARFSDEDQLIGEKSGITLFWVGKPKGERRGGVGFAIRTSLVKQVEQPTSINERIMKMRISLSRGRYLSMLSVYAPTLYAPLETSMSLYEALRNATSSIPKDDKLMLLGDFNARVGKNHATWNAIGRYGIGKINYSGLLLLDLCSEFNLAICNTFFSLKLKHKVTSTHPRSKHGHMIDYIITRKDNIRDVSIVRVIRSAECGNDHFMVRGKFTCKFRIREESRITGI